MKLLYILLATLLAYSLQATPLTEFREALNQQVENFLPEINVTWDPNTPENRKLWDENYTRFRAKEENGIDRHLFFLKKLTGDQNITVDSSGNPDLYKTITLSGKDWLLKATNPRDTHSKQYQKWGMSTDCEAANIAKQAFAKLKADTIEALRANPTNGLQNFAGELKRAMEALDEFGQNVIDANKLRDLNRFITKYAG